MLALIGAFLVSILSLATNAENMFHLRSLPWSGADILNTTDVQVSFFPYEKAFEDFKTKFGREYENSRDEANHFTIFRENVLLLEAHNRRYAAGQTTYYKGVNKFTDTDHRRIRRSSGSCYIHSTGSMCSTYTPAAAADISQSIDWRQKGAVTEVKNQGGCGSCWAFGAVGALEAQLFKTTGKLVDLSPQQLVDCSATGDYRNKGCGGGETDDAFKYIIDKGGIMSDKSYPYIERQGTCRFNKSKVVAKCSRCFEIENEQDLVNAVATKGPVAVAIHFSDDLSAYEGGVFDDDCSGVLNHVVLVVGYTADYWIIKNSHDKDWGDKGYLHLPKFQNKCGIASEAYLASAAAHISFSHFLTELIIAMCLCITIYFIKTF